MKNKFAIAFVIYNPDAIFYERVKFLLSEGYYIYIYDNSDDVKKYHLNFNNKNIDYTADKCNSGLGYGISYLSKKASAYDFEALLFFDQDTGFNLETLLFINKIYVDNIDILKKASVINFCNNSIDKESRIEKVDLVINSGSLFILKNLKIIGWHDKSFFVDGVDYKFCVDSRINNLDILKITSTPGFDHVTEQDDSDYRVLGKNFRFREYSISRVKDYIKSSIKLILFSLKNRQYKYSYIFFKYLAYYLLVQSYVRIVKKFNKKEDNDNK